MTFTDRDLLLLAIVLPVLIGIGVVRWARRRRLVAQALAEARLLDRLGASGLVRFPWLRLILLGSGALSLGIAAAGPRWGAAEARTESRSRNVVLAVDISKSMLAQDVAPDRLERARVLLRRTLRDLAADRIGLVVFAGRAYVLSPLTTDHSALQLYIDALDPEMVSQGGSSVAAAITQATDLARGPSGRARNAAVVLISDGEALEELEAITEAAQRAARVGVVVHAVGLGTEEGARIPDYEPGSRRLAGYKTDPYGNTVISKLDQRVLQTVAEQAGGEYFRLDQPGAAAGLVKRLKDLERTAGESAARSESKDRSAWFIALGLILLIADVLFARGRDLKSMRPAGPAVLKAATIVLLFTSINWGIGVLERGNRHYRAGRYEEAVKAYEQALREGKDSPELRYNLGTALIRLGRFDVADEHMQRALRARTAEVRQRAHFNNGFRALVAGRNGGAEAKDRLATAIESYKHSLRLDPRDLDAKWNLELALRDQEKEQKSPSGGQDQPQDQGSGGNDQQKARSGGQGSSQSQSSAGDGNDQGRSMQQRPMSQEQADRILSAIEQDERELTKQKLRKGQRRTAVARDW